MSTKRLFYIDNLRIFLISLVVLHHLAITYGAPGGWYYNESEAHLPEIVPLSMFVATNQAFFMGMFFFISAFFIPSSLARKGVSKFATDRLVRLGIPTLLFFFFLNPLTNFIANYFIRGQEPGLLDHILSGKSFGFGPTWFIEALILFTFIYLIIQYLPGKIKIKFPGTFVILLIAILIALAQFTIRIWLPVGWSWGFTNFQFPHFVQYIVLFSLGIVAWQNNWLDDIHPPMGMRWFLFSQLLIFIGFPALFILGKAPQNGIEPFTGGLTYQSFMYAIWEQLVGFSLILGLLGIFKNRFNRQGKLAKQLSASAYAVFVFHAPIIVAISALFLHLNLTPWMKFLVLSPVALLSSFIIAWLVKQVPGLKQIF